MRVRPIDSPRAANRERRRPVDTRPGVEEGSARRLMMAPGDGRRQPSAVGYSRAGRRAQLTFLLGIVRGTSRFYLRLSLVHETLANLILIF